MDERRNPEEILNKVFMPENLAQKISMCQRDWYAIHSEIGSIQDKLRKVKETEKVQFRVPRIEETKPS